MAMTRTICVDFGTLSRRGPSAVLILKLMMACNDLTVTNQALGDWENETRPAKTSRRSGAGWYFVRAQISHLYEGFNLIPGIRADRALQELLHRTDPQTQRSFLELEHYVKGGSRRKRFEKLAGQIRQNVTFHYNQSGKLITRAISGSADGLGVHVSSITRGTAAHLWHFKVADDIVESIILRQLWNIPRTGDTVVEAKLIVDEVQQIALCFLDFSTEFIWAYCQR